MFFWSSTTFRECYATFVFSHGPLLLGILITFSINTIPNLKDDGIRISPVLPESVIGCVPLFVIGISTFFTTFVTGMAGRKRILQITLIVYIVGMTMATVAFNVFVLLAGVIVATSVGSSFLALVTTYVSEVSHKKRRGIFIYAAYATIALGQGVAFVLDSLVPWRVISAIAVIVAVSGFLQTLLLPETKYWYLLQQNADLAKTSALWFRPHSNSTELDESIETIKKIIENDSNAKSAHTVELIKNLRKIKYAKPFALGLLLCVTRSSNGKGVFAVYLTSILEDLYIPYDFAVSGSWLGIGGQFGNAIMFALIYNLNRKTVIYTSSLVLIACSAVVIGYKFLRDIGELTVPPWLVVICAFTYMVVVDVAYNSSLSVLIAEIQVAYYRMEIVCFLNGILYWLSGFYLYSFPYFQTQFSIENLMLFFLLNVIVSLVIVHFCFPETSDLEFYETEKIADLVCESEGAMECSFDVGLVPTF